MPGYDAWLEEPYHRMDRLSEHDECTICDGEMTPEDCDQYIQDTIANNQLAMEKEGHDRYADYQGL